jgi:hypothetical protein
LGVEGDAIDTTGRFQPFLYVSRRGQRLTDLPAAGQRQQQGVCRWLLYRYFSR